jgi:hypothetical protein
MAAMVGPAPDGKASTRRLRFDVMSADDELVPEPVPLARPRALTQKERALIDILLAGPLGKPELRRQAASARVVGVCSCGCPSVHLEVDPSAPRATFTPEEAPFGRADGVLITAWQEKSRGATEVTLHVLDGRLSELEIWAGTFGVRPRVDPAKLEYFDWSPSEDA